MFVNLTLTLLITMQRVRKLNSNNRAHRICLAFPQPTPEVFFTAAPCAAAHRPTATWLRSSGEFLPCPSSPPPPPWPLSPPPDRRPLWRCLRLVRRACLVPASPEAFLTPPEMEKKRGREREENSPQNTSEV